MSQGAGRDFIPDWCYNQGTLGCPDRGRDETIDVRAEDTTIPGRDRLYERQAPLNFWMQYGSFSFVRVMFKNLAISILPGKAVWF